MSEAHIPRIVLVSSSSNKLLVGLLSVLSVKKDIEVKLFPENSGGFALPQVERLGVAESLLERSKVTRQIVITHDDVLFNFFRVAVVQGKLPPEDIELWWADGLPSKVGDQWMKKYHMDEQGYIQDWPEGFFDITEKELAQLA